MFSDDDIARFNSRFVKAGDDECWPWTYHVGHAGHGRMWAGKRNTLATHIALWLDGRPRPTGKAALHSCDNPSCVNPSHLRWGTQLENITDRVSRGRCGSALGQQNSSSKLTPEQVRLIRNDSRSQRKIAAEYGVTQPAIRAILRGKTWRWVGNQERQESKSAQSAVINESTRKIHACP